MASPWNKCVVSQNIIAEQLGLGQATVARALSRCGSVKPETARRIQECARKLNYVHSESARTLRRGVSLNLHIAFFGSTPLQHPFYIKFLTGCMQGACDAHRDLLISQQPDDERQAQAFLARVRATRPGGVILSGDVPRGVYAELADQGIPHVYLGNEYVPEGTHNVAVNGEQAADLAVEYLHAAGYREILLLGPSRSPPIHRSIADGYWKAIDRLGLDAQWTQAQIAIAGATPLGQWIRGRTVSAGPLALLLINEQYGVSALQQLSVEGIAVPDDVGVMSFGDTPMALACHPKLTTVSFQMEEAGRKAVEVLLAMRRREDTPCVILLPGVLVERDSCRRPLSTRVHK